MLLSMGLQQVGQDLVIEQLYIYIYIYILYRSLLGWVTLRKSLSLSEP